MQQKRSTKMIKIGMSLLMGGVFFATYADYSGFVSQLNTVGIKVDQIQKQSSVTRYDITRLLNAVECKDCVKPIEDTINKYTDKFWSEFLKVPGRDFNDIDMSTAINNQINYYYCVAYVGENNYMRGYPAATSPLCAGKFCGFRGTTNAEFLQVIMNILTKYIYDKININRKEVNDWFEKLDTQGYVYKTLNQQDAQNIHDGVVACKTPPCILQKPEDVNTYLKYCMFNLEKCGMAPIGKIKQGVWPVAELNLLSKQNIISVDQAGTYQIDKMVEGKKVIETLANIYDLVGCNFNNDYDCDGILNAQDSCPNDYSPHQKDTDKDGIGDVCDDDIDNDGIKNPIGIVDDLGRINVRLYDPKMDNCLFTVNTDQKDLAKNNIGDTCENQQDALAMYISIDQFKGSAPLTAKFKAITKGPWQSIAWDFGDGGVGSGQAVEHLYLQGGAYTVRATAKGLKTNDAIAKVTLYIGKSANEKKAIQPLMSNAGGSLPLEVSFLASTVGNPQKVERIIDGQTGIVKGTNESFKKLWNENGSHQVLVKAQSDGQIVGISSFRIGAGNARGAILKSDSINPNLKQVVNFDTKFHGFKNEDISSVFWDFGDGEKIRNTQLQMTHQYKVSGQKSVMQIISFKDGSEMPNIITLYAINPLFADSFALQTIPSQLYFDIFNKIDFTSTIVGGKLEGFQNVLTTYDDGNTKKDEFSSKFVFPYKLSHLYTKGGIFYPETKISIDQCNSLQAQSTIGANGGDLCFDAARAGKLKNFKCDLDKDGIPDMCDDDIDGDGPKNLMGIITSENPSCSYILDEAKGTVNIDKEILLKHFQGVCSLDNSPLGANPDQLDLNKDNMGDQGNDFLSGSSLATPNDVSKDTDGDGILDVQDLCPAIKGDFPDGCPNIAAQLACEKQEPAKITCMQCPCPYTDFSSSITNNDQLQAVLWDRGKTIPYSYSAPYVPQW